MNRKFATGGEADDDGGGGWMGVLKKVYPLGQVLQITTTQHCELLPQQRQEIGSQVANSRNAANTRKARDMASSVPKIRHAR